MDADVVFVFFGFVYCGFHLGGGGVGGGLCLCVCIFVLCFSSLCVCVWDISSIMLYSMPLCGANSWLDVVYVYV